MSDTHVIAIGGESDDDLKCMTPIDEYIISLTGKAAPVVLYISTANGDDPVKIADFSNKYAAIGCSVIPLAFFIPPFPHAQQISSMFEKADIIYVAGGNTRAMLAVWREFGVTDLLKAAGDQGKILCGVSAGAICWFDFGHSDSGGAFALINGLGMLPGALCPHFNSEEGRKTSFVELIATSAFNLPTPSTTALPCTSKTVAIRRPFTMTPLAVVMQSPCGRPT
ncbi:Peptidase E [Pseudomonas sp. R1-43-08]|uniref:Type 1 glutamine amidotransferase-like domain-containing protein n=1 Tax=Pseudomonas sp. R1-43-08 TaxID=1173270 RepID=UPI000F5814AD|nr:Type 1 glutamine amidotransferase-like domain-containing protein [Pseudomonas sp. R1-43-08]AZF42393.1 Peptidase E [Pseudomonas sp. R1-43-08]